MQKQSEHFNDVGGINWCTLLASLMDDTFLKHSAQRICPHSRRYGVRCPSGRNGVWQRTQGMIEDGTQLSTKSFAF